MQLPWPFHTTCFTTLRYTIIHKCFHKFYVETQLRWNDINRNPISLGSDFDLIPLSSWVILANSITDCLRWSLPEPGLALLQLTKSGKSQRERTSPGRRRVQGKQRRHSVQTLETLMKKVNKIAVENEMILRFNDSFKSFNDRHSSGTCSMPGLCLNLRHIIT